MKTSTVKNSLWMLVFDCLLSCVEKELLQCTDKCKIDIYKNTSASGLHLNYNFCQCLTRFVSRLFIGFIFLLSHVNYTSILRDRVTRIESYRIVNQCECDSMVKSAEFWIRNKKLYRKVLKDETRRSFTFVLGPIS